MKFVGTQVSMSSTQEGITIKMKDGDTVVSLFLEPMEGAQLMTYLLNVYGLAEVVLEDDEEFDDEEKKVTH